MESEFFSGSNVLAENVFLFLYQHEVVRHY